MSLGQTGHTAGGVPPKLFMLIGVFAFPAKGCSAPGTCHSCCSLTFTQAILEVTMEEATLIVGHSADTLEETLVREQELHYLAETYWVCFSPSLLSATGRLKLSDRQH